MLLMYPYDQPPFAGRFLKKGALYETERGKAPHTGRGTVLLAADVRRGTVGSGPADDLRGPTCRGGRPFHGSHPERWGGHAGMLPGLHAPGGGCGGAAQGL